MVARDQDVGRLDVAVHEPGGVRGVERVGDLGDDARGPRGLEAALAPQQPVQVGARHVAHDEVEVAVLLARRVDRDDVRVVDRRGQPRLALEALAERRGPPRRSAAISFSATGRPSRSSVAR